MADEIHVERQESQPDIRGADGSPTQQRRPRSTAEAERAIDETRGRISRDLDQIEGRIAREKDRIENRAGELKRRADVLSPARSEVRKRPWPSIGAAAGAGLLLGLLTGGRDDHEARRDDRLAARERDELERLRAERRVMKASEAARRRDAERRNEGRDWKHAALEKFQRAALAQARTALTAAVTGAVTGGAMKKV